MFLTLVRLALDLTALLLYSPAMSWTRPKFTVKLPNGVLRLGERTLVMGILNVTPDSFSDGGKFLDVDRAVERAIEMQQQGADLIDVGGESSRPGSRRIPYEEELHRVVPVLERLRGKLSVPLSIDTYKSEVAARAVKLGAGLVNDISAGQWDSMMFETTRRLGAALLLMHMRGDPQSWKRLKPRRAVVQSVVKELQGRCNEALRAGISRRRILIDPGIGFGKNPDENLRLLRGLEEFGMLGFPVCVGPSRKSFLAGALPRPAAERVMGTAATVAIAVMKGAHMVRVHDVAEIAEVVRVADAVSHAAR